MRSYGIPYMGSKNKIAKWVLEHLPKAKNLYDVMCGGCAVTHCAMASGKYEKYYINDINGLSPKFFVDAIAGKFKDDDRWISREDFHGLKYTDPVVAYCWSFGNNPDKGYLYGAKIEPMKRAWHHAVYYKDYSLMAKFDIDLTPIDGIEGVRNRYLASKKILRGRVGRFDLQSLETMMRLQDLGGESYVTPTSSPYSDLSILPDSVIYCDPPYRGTATYGKDVFDHESFYDWCELQTELIVISEYWMPKERFVCIAEKKKRVTLSAADNSAVKIEKLFVPKHQEELYKSKMQ